MVPLVSEGGNTKTPSERRICPRTKWCFTWNNPEEGWMDLLVQRFHEKKMKFGFQLECGKEENTPHVQGWVSTGSVKKIRPFSLKLPSKIHWEGMKGTLEQNIEYCSKADTKVGEYHTNEKKRISMEIEEEDILPLEEMFEWGKSLVGMVKDVLPEKRDRRIFWYWSSSGCMKKTETARYLCYHHDAVVIQGGRKHVLANAFKNPAPIYCLLIPRTDEGFVSYASLELLKDALFMSAFGTEATGSCNRKKPWVIAFANFAPDRSALSEDRWVVECVDQICATPPWGA